LYRKIVKISYSINRGMDWLEELKNIPLEKPSDAEWGMGSGELHPNYKHGMCVGGKNTSEYNAEWFKEYYKENREELLEYQKNYYRKNKEKKRKERLEYYQNNKEKIKEKARHKYHKDKSKGT
tara:strand:+ start:562 stop:930 length:369 start_codon:yes stop_codon:yes gene_type:complete